MLTPASLLPKVLSIAEQAGAVILQHYTQGTTVSTKADASPVTAADEAGEAVILAGLRALTPEIPIVAEEAVSRGEIPDVGDGAFWLVDPLDGTKEFISKNGEFTVNIGLVDQKRPVLGVVLAPARGLAGGGRRATVPRAAGTVRSASSRYALGRARCGRGRQPVAPRCRDRRLAGQGRHRRHCLGRKLAQVLLGGGRQGRRLSPLRADHGVGYRSRRCGPARGRRPGRDDRWRAVPLRQGGLPQPGLHRSRRLSLGGLSGGRRPGRAEFVPALRLLHLLPPETAHRLAIRGLPWLPARPLPELPRLRVELPGSLCSIRSGSRPGSTRTLRPCRPPAPGLRLRRDRHGHAQAAVGQSTATIVSAHRRPGADQPPGLQQCGHRRRRRTAGWPGSRLGRGRRQYWHEQGCRRPRRRLCAGAFGLLRARRLCHAERLLAQHARAARAAKARGAGPHPLCPGPVARPDPTVPQDRPRLGPRGRAGRRALPRARHRRPDRRQYHRLAPIEPRARPLPARPAV